jgi:hypothetical protein
VNPQDGTIGLVQFLMIPFLNFSLFYKAVECFINGIELWHTKELASLEATEPSLPPEARDVDQPNAEIITVSPYLKDFSQMTPVRVLGRGPFGFVTLVEDTSTHENVILEAYDAITDSRRFMAEVEILVGTSHPCIVPIIGFSLPVRNQKACIAVKPFDLITHGISFIAIYDRTMSFWMRRIIRTLDHLEMMLI